MGVLGSKNAPTNDNDFLAILETFSTDGNSEKLIAKANEYFKGKKYSTASSFDIKTCEWRSFGWEFAPTNKELQELRAIMVGRNVLDIGSGAFGLIGFYALCFGAKSYTAVDIVKENVENSLYFLTRVKSFFRESNTLIRVLKCEEDSWTLDSSNGQKMHEELQHSGIETIVARNLIHHTKPDVFPAILSFITSVAPRPKEQMFSVYVVVDHTIQNTGLFRSTVAIRKQISDLAKGGHIDPNCVNYLNTYVLKTFTSSDGCSSNGFYRMIPADARLNLEMIKMFAWQYRRTYDADSLERIMMYDDANKKVPTMKKSVVQRGDYFPGAIENFYRTGLLTPSSVQQTLLFLPDAVDMQKMIAQFNPQNVKITYCDGGRQVTAKELEAYCAKIISGEELPEWMITMAVSFEV